MSEEKEKVVTKNARSKLGKDKYEEILEKDWKKTKVPKNYDKRRGRDGRKLNKNSLKNLVQYRERTPKEKEIALGQLRFKEKKKEEPQQENLPQETEELTALQRILKTIPMDAIFEDDEAHAFKDLLRIYLKDFDEEDLTAADLDDIISLAMNRVHEIRLLQYGKETPSKLIDASQSIERLRKNTEKLKDSLAARRKDRVKYAGKEGISMVDLVAMYEKEKKEARDERTANLLREEEHFLRERAESGNRDDTDAKMFNEEL